MIAIDYAKTFLHKPYLWCGSNPLSGMDCSGFIQCVLAGVGMDDPGKQNAQQLYEGFKKSGSIGIKGPGALIFYGSSSFNISHISMMISLNQIIECGGGDHTTVNTDVAARQGACVRIRPASHRSTEICAIVMPNYPEWVKNG